MLKYSRFYVLLILISLITTSCSNNSPTPSPTPVATIPPTPALPTPSVSTQESLRRKWLNRIDQFETRWKAANVTNYEITTSYTPQHLSNPQVFYVMVKNGKVVGQGILITPGSGSVSDQAVAKKSTSFAAEKYTVPGLFEIARQKVEEYISGWPKTNLQIDFDSILGYPSNIIITPNNAQSNNEDVWWVTRFKVL